MEETTPERGLLTEAGHFSELTVNRHLQGELLGDDKRLFDEHIKGCLVCRQYVDRLESFDRKWRTEHAWPVDGPAAAPVPPPSPERATPDHLSVPPPSPNRWLAPTAGVLAMAAAVLLVVWVSGDGAPKPPSQIDGPGPVNIKGGGFSFMVYADRAGGAQRLSTGQTVHPGDKLGFRIHTDDPGHLMIAGVDEKKQPYLCHPQPPRKASVAIEAAPDGVTLNAAVELDDLLGKERIVAIMCPRPFTFEEIKAGLAAGIAENSLLLEGCSQRELTLHKTPKSGSP